MLTRLHDITRCPDLLRWSRERRRGLSSPSGSGITFVFLLVEEALNAKHLAGTENHCCHSSSSVMGLSETGTQLECQYGPWKSNGFGGNPSSGNAVSACLRISPLLSLFPA